MFAQSILLPALALAGAVAAASQPTLCSKPTATITNAADAGALAQCTSVSGSIVISSDASGVIDLSGPKEVGGDIVAHNAGNLVSLTSSSIKSIGGKFDLFNLTTLSTLSFDKLTKVDTIKWSALPFLGQLTFPEFISEANSVTIENTVLTTLQGINLDKVDVMNINNNRRLSTIATQVGSVGTSLNIASNGIDLSIELPNLVWASNATFRNASSISIPSLSVVNGTLTFDENTFTTFSAPNLTSIGDKQHSFGSFTFASNLAVKNITLPALTTIAGANQIANNKALTTISFPALEYVGGAISFAGNFTTPELSALKDVVGGFSLESTAEIDCAPFKAEAGPSKTLRGKFNCVSATKDPQPLESGSGGSSSGDGSTKKNAAFPSYSYSETAVGLSFIGGLLQMIL